MSKTVLFQTIQFSESTQFCSIRFIDSTQSGATNPNQSGPGSDGIEEVLRILQSSSIIECHIPDTHLGGGGLIPLQRSSRCILQPQPTEQYEV